MCDPVIGAVIGGGQAALGVMGQNKALGARNKNRALLYGRDLNTIHSKHLENVSNYYLRGVDAEIAWDDNLIAASQQIDRQQTAVNAKIAESLRNTEDAYVKMMSDPRIAKSLERSGRSARRVSQSFKAALGRTKARSAATVDDQVDQSLGLLEEISEWRRRQDREATMKIGLEPQRAADPPKPVFEKGPSLFSSLMKIAIGAAQGYLMGNELKEAGLFQGGGGNLATKPKELNLAAIQQYSQPAKTTSQLADIAASTPLKTSSALNTEAIVGLSASTLQQIEYYSPQVQEEEAINISSFASEQK